MNEDRRTVHPFHMYEAIQAQPEAFARVVERNEPAVDEFAASISNCERLFVIGIGTSFHAARVGEYLVRAYGGGLDVRAMHSFDFALYGPPLGPGDCVVAVSHRGSKRYTAAALARAREAGCRTALITGEGGSGADSADAAFITVPQEKSAAHTVSYTTAVAVLALLARGIGQNRTGAETMPESLLREEVPAALSSALGTEEGMKALAREYVGRRRIWLAGGGPSTMTAEETALKIKETSYLQAEGMSAETLMHGPFACADVDDLFVLVAPSGAARERTLEVAELAVELGAPILTVSDEAAGLPRDAATVLVPPVPEPFTALTCLVPLQFFAYRLALARGKNPDSFRADDPLFPKIRERVRL